MSFNPFASAVTSSIVNPVAIQEALSNQNQTNQVMVHPTTQTEVITPTVNQVSNTEVIQGKLEVSTSTPEPTIENIPIVFWKDKKLRQFAPTSPKALKAFFLTVDVMTDETGLRLKKPAVCDVIIEKMLKDLGAESVKGLNHQYIDSIWTALKMSSWKERDGIRKQRENINYHKLSFDFDALAEIED